MLNQRRAVFSLRLQIPRVHKLCTNFQKKEAAAFEPTQHTKPTQVGPTKQEKALPPAIYLIFWKEHRWVICSLWNRKKYQVKKQELQQ